MASDSTYWAIILGGSGGIGWAACKKLAQSGYNIFIVHRDRSERTRELKTEMDILQTGYGIKWASFNANVLIEEGKNGAINEINNQIGPHQVKVFVHALAYGTLGPVFEPENQLNIENVNQTVHSMGTGYLEWAQLLFKNELLSDGARLIGLTSAGSHVTGKNYAAVGAAKGALETINRYLAVELAGYNITSNLINAGVTDTPGLRAIPNHSEIMESAKASNPFGRLTTPDDVANAIYLLTLPEAGWINGSIIQVDGGEQITGI